MIKDLQLSVLQNSCLDILNKEKHLYIIAMLGAMICFIGDNLLGYYTQATDFGNKLMCVSFSYEWAEANPNRFVVAGICGVVSLLMMFAGFYGIYFRMKRANSKLSKPFLFGAFMFVSVGTMYHIVFAIAVYIYNNLSASGLAEVKELTLDVFNILFFVFCYLQLYEVITVSKSRNI